MSRVERLLDYDDGRTSPPVQLPRQNPEMPLARFWTRTWQTEGTIWQSGSALPNPTRQIYQMLNTMNGMSHLTRFDS
jgi:hypothetical protein